VTKFSPTNNYVFAILFFANLFSTDKVRCSKKSNRKAKQKSTTKSKKAQQTEAETKKKDYIGMFV